MPDNIVVENNFLSPEKNDALNKALENQQAGKNLLRASQDIVRLTNEDRASNELLDNYRQGKLSDGDKKELAGLLNQYGYELQTVYDYSEDRAREAVQSLVNGKAFVAAAADAKAYNEALGYLKGYSVQSGQAAVGTDALLALPGIPGTIVRSAVMAGGAYQEGTGIGQVIEGEYAEGALNIGLGTAAIFGGAAGNKVLSKNESGVRAPHKESGVGKNTQPSTEKLPAKNGLAVDEEAAGWSQYDKYRNESGNWNWPAKLGFSEEPVKKTLPVGTRLDRYGEPGGSFLAPKGTPYEQRALAPGAKADKYYEYEVIKPLPVMQGKIAPAFGEPGGGIQILPNMQERVNVEWLLKNEYIREVH